YERVRYATADGWRELAGADQLQPQLLQSAPPLKVKIQPPDKGRWRTYTTADGLPSDHVLRICFARDGAAWVGTQRGAARFDGRQFQSLNRTDGLLDDTVFSICEARDGGGWFGCQSVAM